MYVKQKKRSAYKNFYDTCKRGFTGKTQAITRDFFAGEFRNSFEKVNDVKSKLVNKNFKMIKLPVKKLEELCGIIALQSE